MKKTFLAVAMLGSVAVPGLLAQSGVIEVYSKVTNVEVGTKRQFTKYVSVSPSTVVWSVNDVVGGSAQYGTIDHTGYYMAPLIAPMANVVIIKATSTAYPAKFGYSTTTLVQPTPWVYGCSPLTMPVGPISLKISGVGFTPTSVVRFGATELTTTYISPTQLTATGMALASQAGTVAVRVNNPGPGAVLGQAVNATVTAPPVSVSVSPAAITLGLNAAQMFVGTVSGSVNTGVNWSVNGVAGGNATVGTVSAAGLYTAPAAVPYPATVKVRAASAASATSYAEANVTLQAPPPAGPVLSSVSPGTIPQGAFTITVNGANFGAGSQVRLNGTGLSTQFVSSTQLTATGTTNALAGAALPVSVANPGTPEQVSAAVSVTVSAPASGVSYLSAARFLEQAGFGPTPAEIAAVQSMGFAAWLDQQFAMAATSIAPAPGQVGEVRDQYLYRLAGAPDQVRQKMIYALGNLLVISTHKNIYSPEVEPYLQILSDHAFGNYRSLLKAVSMSSQMGKYLDLANSAKPGSGGGANENYARELMQLFTIGLVKLNPDGSPQTDAAGVPVPTYNQAAISQFALALTGWTYPTAPGATPRSFNWESFNGPLESRQENHDLSVKTLLNGTVLPPGQTVMQDLDGVLDNLFNHPNMGPFLATRLIRAMVMSNPTGAYIQRVANVFNDNGFGVRGDLKAVARAVLLDPEARQDTPGVNSGKLKEPVFYLLALTRALKGQVANNTALGYVFAQMGNQPLAPASVFSFYSPMYRVPKSPLFGPEFQIYSATESLVRGNFAYSILGNQMGSSWKVDLTPFTAVAGNVSQLLDLVDQTLLYGRMDAGLRAALAKAMVPSIDNNQRMMTALYLTALSGQYAVQY